MRSQRGFTLMEVMVSTMATAVVIAAASAFLLRFLAWYDELSAKIAMNRHARPQTGLDNGSRSCQVETSFDAW